MIWEQLGAKRARFELKRTKSEKEAVWAPQAAPGATCGAENSMCNLGSTLVGAWRRAGRR